MIPVHRVGLRGRRRLEAFENSDFTSVSAVNAEISANFTDTMFKDANLEGVKFVGTFKNVVFEGANLRNADLTQVELAAGGYGGTSFNFANLQGAQFGPGELGTANFQGADLSGAEFPRNVVRYPNMWRNARFNAATRLPFTHEDALEMGMIFVE